MLKLSIFSSQTIEARLELYFESHGEHRRWIHILQHIVEAYNNSIHSAIDRTPNSVNRENQKQVFDYEEQKRQHFITRKRYAKYRIGDLVRVPLKSLPGYKAKTFIKGAKAKWSKDLYKIVEIHYGTYVPMYSLQDQFGARLNRRYYENSINHVKHISDRS